ncbi:B-cell antigen receptor complex-associated protein beta chain [Anarrhichthys ocellatus]|uniref:B-cell antigen receptor complex-associated protein beta chain n=1 Tax=Anarrhichthys ocellatus TaxID=433405 RepID=UPI0012EE2F31|nr:B-cell antigen receptor complex-associated protein beta chain [Anarrhichthys ocellatus]
MCWLLAGCCGLALISISVAPDPAVQITQKPRFCGVKTRYNVIIGCMSTQDLLSAKVQWYKADKYNEDVLNRGEIEEEQKFKFFNSHSPMKFLFISGVRIEDRGVYFCKLNDTWGPGTAVEVIRPIGLPQALHRTNMKDGLIILQGLVLAGCIAAILLRRRQLLEKNDSIYEEPDTDHIYEGLAIETCGGDLYEELSVYAQADGAEGAEAPWE